jgi:hypothetical protein
VDWLLLHGTGVSWACAVHLTSVEDSSMRVPSDALSVRAYLAAPARSSSKAPALCGTQVAQLREELMGAAATELFVNIIAA